MGDNFVNFTCAVQAPPNTGLNVTILWYFRGGRNFGEFVTIDTRDGQVINASSTVTISRAWPSTGGAYSCRAFIGSIDNQIIATTHVAVQCKYNYCASDIVSHMYCIRSLLDEGVITYAVLYALLYNCFCMPQSWCWC